MSGCAGCQRAPVPSPNPTLLFHIQRRYRAEWKGLLLSLQMDSIQWTLCIRNEARNETLYTAYRGTESAQSLAAADFAITHIMGFRESNKPKGTGRRSQVAGVLVALGSILRLND